MGCSYCSSTRGSPASHCYTYGRPELCDKNGTVSTNNGAACDDQWMLQRSCNNFTSCSTCLATWPAHTENKPVCQWCQSCGRGICKNAGEDCSGLANKCETPPDTISVAESCSDLLCAASDCNKCVGEQCVWTRQVYMDDTGLQVDIEPIHDWTCVSKPSLGRHAYRLTNSGECQSRCHFRKDCRSCVRVKGAESGTGECHWAIHLNRCIPPAYKPLYCAGGVCGLVLGPDDMEQCPSPCSIFTQCSECLHHAHCGWCSRDGGQGEGICTEGSRENPLDYNTQSTCSAVYASKRTTESESEISSNDTFSWNYIRCPPEDECTNNHHNCDPVSELCVDQPYGFRCDCGAGHAPAKVATPAVGTSGGPVCVAVCLQGCVRGNCVRPGVCECDFGYVGANCSIQCQCNGHANCVGPDKLNECLECHNNTMGKQCEKCKPLFVGDPTDNGQCVPCSEYCHGHTGVCTSELGEEEGAGAGLLVGVPTEHLGEGGARARCLQCANNTDGMKCDKCIDGHFRGSENYRDPCRPCECHGHGDTCDPVSGEKCNCGNNTESDGVCQAPVSLRNSAQECWRYQCVKCRDLFMGDPKNGHQCYKMMSADNKICFKTKTISPSTIEDCNKNGIPLQPERTAFFVIIPRFMNVDIRIIVDVTQGAVDLFLSPDDSSFIVVSNASTGAHQVQLDPSYFTPKKDDIFRVPEPFEDNFWEKHHHSTWLSDGKTDYTMVNKKANGLATYVTVEKKNTILHVRELRNRLVLTLPQTEHNLTYTKFYVVLRSLSRDTAGTASLGLMFFRQDQLHIDLFVFFSVFFSCFFLFLAACVVAWKAKQAADVRRARRRQVVEMLHMAKRPFAAVTIVMAAPTMLSGGTRRRRKYAECRPVAVEPTASGTAAVTTVLVRLPGGKCAPARIALASTLVLLARPPAAPARAFLRRRSAPHAPLPT